MAEIHPFYETYRGGCGNGAMVEPLRHRQTKGAATDMFYLTPPRHISTLPRSYGAGGKGLAPLSLCENRWRCPMPQIDDLSRSLIAFEQNSTMVVVLEMSQSSWLAAGVVPGIERRPLKKLDSDPTALLRLVGGWRAHAVK